MSSPRESGSPRDGRGKRDNGKPEMLLGKGIVPIHVPKTARPTSSRFQKYSDHLPDRYLSQMTPFSTPLYDARVHVARAKSHFKRKLHHLVQIFVRVDKNKNGLIPRTEVRWCCVLTCTPRRAAAMPYARARAPVSCARRAHEAQGSSPRGGTTVRPMYQCMYHVPCALVPIFSFTNVPLAPQAVLGGREHPAAHGRGRGDAEQGVGDRRRGLLARDHTAPGPDRVQRQRRPRPGRARAHRGRVRLELRCRRRRHDDRRRDRTRAPRKSWAGPVGTGLA